MLGELRRGTIQIRRWLDLRRRQNQWILLPLPVPLPLVGRLAQHGAAVGAGKETAILAHVLVAKHQLGVVNPALHLLELLLTPN